MRISDQLVAIIGTLALGFAVGVQFAGRYIYGQLVLVSGDGPPWVETLQMVSMVALGMFGLSVFVALALDYRRSAGVEG